MPGAIPIPQAVQEAVVLTDYAVVTRYPGAYEPVEDVEYREALALAEAVVSWAESAVAGSPSSVGPGAEAVSSGTSPAADLEASCDGSESEETTS